MRDHTAPLCPLPHSDTCVRERCPFWDEAQEACSGDGFDTWEPLDATGAPNLDTPCIIPYTEDYD
jgi:hypothetical protein